MRKKAAILFVGESKRAVLPQCSANLFLGASHFFFFLSFFAELLSWFSCVPLCDTEIILVSNPSVTALCDSLCHMSF